MLVASIPIVLQGGKATAPFMIGLFALAIGAGIFKPNLLPILFDQDRHQEEYVKTLKTGEKVIVDPEVTINRLSLIFYGFVNLGAFLKTATTYSEKLVGFWLAFLISGVIYLLLPLLLLLSYKKTYCAKPQGSEMTNVLRLIAYAMRHNKAKVWNRNFWDVAKPSEIARRRETRSLRGAIPWSDALVEDSSLRSLLFLPAVEHD
jgi:dipeptide/tripeptide permease